MKVANEAFGERLELPDNSTEESKFNFYPQESQMSSVEDTKEVFVELPDGQKARVTIPEVG